MTERRFFHYTCSHGAAGIREIGRVMPLHDFLTLSAISGVPASWLARNDVPAVSWWTDLDDPVAHMDDLGLRNTLVHLSCDRTEYGFEATAAHDMFPWALFVALYGANPAWVEFLGADRAPDHWYVSTYPVYAEQVRGPA